MSRTAKGTFEVNVKPQPGDDANWGGFIRLSIDKQFHGALEAKSRGQMLAAGDGSRGSSGGYVALERVNGTLGGRKGSFVLQHSGTMQQGVATLTITVVPGSGTEELQGLKGHMDILITSGKHDYVFEYSLPESQ